MENIFETKELGTRTNKKEETGKFPPLTFKMEFKNA